MTDDLCILIPSRIGSTRIRNKPLIKINNKTLIQRVMINALKISKNSYVATDSELIRENVYEISQNVIMTKVDHISGTDRICEAANSLKLNENTFILNLQGDEPFIPKQLIELVINDFKSNKCDVITVSGEINSEDEISNPNCVLVETDLNDYATNFSRTQKLDNPRRHIGIYGYRLKTLRELVSLEPTTNELNLKLEQMRFLDNKYSIFVSKSDLVVPNGIDTNDDVVSAENYLKEYENN